MGLELTSHRPSSTPNTTASLSMTNRLCRFLSAASTIHGYSQLTPRFPWRLIENGDVVCAEQSDLLTVYGRLTDAIEARITVRPSQLWEN
jgi:hypothetical protein